MPWTNSDILDEEERPLGIWTKDQINQELREGRPSKSPESKHGTISRYMDGCRCEHCSEKRSKYEKGVRARARERTQDGRFVAKP